MAKRRVTKAEQVSPATAPFQAFGISGVPRYGATSRVYEEFLRELQGPQGMKLLKEQIDNCPITGALLFAVQYLARGVTFRVEPGKATLNTNSRRLMGVAQRVEQALFDDLDVTWPDQLSEHLSMCGYGWAVHEMVFKKCQGPTPPKTADPRGGRAVDGTELVPPPMGSASSGQAGQGVEAPRFAPSKFADGFIGLRSAGLRAQETLWMWEWNEESRATVMQQSAPPDYKIRRIPLAKCLHFRTQVAKQNPEGRSLIRNAVIPYLRKKNIEMIEAIGVERDLAGYPYFTTIEPDAAKGIVPPDLWNSKDPQMVQARQKLEAYVKAIRRDEQEGMVLPYWIKFNLANTGSRRQFDTSTIVERYEKRIAMSVLADFIMLGHDAVGSKALASTKSALFTAALNSILDSICAVYNRFCFPLLMELNGIPLDYTPTLAHGDVENVPIDALGDYVQKLSGAGMPLFPNADLEEALLDVAHLPTSGVVDPADEMLDSDTDTELSPIPGDDQRAQAAQNALQQQAGQRPTAAVARKRVRKLIERNSAGRIVGARNF